MSWKFPTKIPMTLLSTGPFLLSNLGQKEWPNFTRCFVKILFLDLDPQKEASLWPARLNLRDF